VAFGGLVLKAAGYLLTHSTVVLAAAVFAISELGQTPSNRV